MDSVPWHLLTAGQSLPAPGASARFSGVAACALLRRAILDSLSRSPCMSTQSTLCSPETSAHVGQSPFAWHVLTALLGVPSASLSRHLRKPCFRFQSQTDLSFGTQSLKITRRALQTWISAICLFHPSFVIFKTALIQFLLQEVQHFSNLNIKLTGNTDTVKWLFLLISAQMCSDISYLLYNTKCSSTWLIAMPLHDNTFHNIWQSRTSQSKTVLNLMSLQTPWLTQQDFWRGVKATMNSWSYQEVGVK